MLSKSSNPSGPPSITHPAWSALAAVEVLTRPEAGGEWPMVLWRPGPGWRMVSSALLGGGIGVRHWVLNAQVPGGYARLDPATHLAELAAYAGVEGPGVGLMTAASVREGRTAVDGGVEALVTAGIGVRGWAAVPERPVPERDVPEQPVPERDVPEPRAVGTINTLVVVPSPLSDAALVNAVSTATEAKVQALLDVGVDASGTPTDAVCVAAPAPSPASSDATALFAGPRSMWGARIARAVHRATALACDGEPEANRT